MLSIIACISQTNRAIGYQNRLLYHIKSDLTRFRELTTGHTIIMGRKTYESLPNGALPHRRNIVVSNSMKEMEGCEVYPNLEAALKAAESPQEIFIIGGESIYRQSLPAARKLYLTVVDDATVNDAAINATPQQADAFFPEINPKEWKLIEKEMRNENGLSFSFLTYLKK
ncbi:dihydrofolate reductase [Segatella copri]|uniref:dihydrofolate reductase n=1 Tax=Segatella copri TaxID=165179 RepID=UPI001931F0F7|nr:dihydrofolate reductase [Segatella copri]MBM0144599.1 dihydrofolate reductase [Segatella copri]